MRTAIPELEATIQEYHKSEMKTAKSHLRRYLPDADILTLYEQADVFIYPSLYEGFGLPVLEAMACGARL